MTTRNDGRILDVIGLVFRLVLGVVLLIAGGLKIGDLEQSARAVKAYRIMDPAIAEFVGYVLPPAELVLGTLLVVGLFVRAAALASGALMVVFIAGIASVWVRDISIQCGCFNAGGDLEGPINPYEYAREIFRDIVLAAMAAWLVVRPRTAFSLDALARPHLHLPHLPHHHDDAGDALGPDAAEGDTTDSAGDRSLVTGTDRPSST
jgi:uncharacterized membrane protein YphA (DoxX/SURF4 family)